MWLPTFYSSITCSFQKKCLLLISFALAPFLSFKWMQLCSLFELQHENHLHSCVYYFMFKNKSYVLYHQIIACFCFHKKYLSDKIWNEIANNGEEHEHRLDSWMEWKTRIEIWQIAHIISSVLIELESGPKYNADTFHGCFFFSQLDNTVKRINKINYSHETKIWYSSRNSGLFVVFFLIELLWRRLKHNNIRVL